MLRYTTYSIEAILKPNFLVQINLSVLTSCLEELLRSGIMGLKISQDKQHHFEFY